jgi:antitoxin component YwqK of YwqJK toxin-antitoxin module
MKTNNSKPEKNGHYTDYFKGGEICSEGNFVNGEREGEWKYYLVNGLLKAIGNYTAGKMAGDWRWYRENGELMQTGSFDGNEQKNGLWTRYKAAGELLDVTRFLDGKKVKDK